MIILVYCEEAQVFNPSFYRMEQCPLVEHPDFSNFVLDFCNERGCGVDEIQVYEVDPANYFTLEQKIIRAADRPHF